MAKYTFEQVVNFIKSKNCQLLQDFYNGYNEEMSIKFSCGHTSDIKYCNFKRRDYFVCNSCAIKIFNPACTLDYNNVKQFIEEKNCELLSCEYKGVNEDLSIIGICGHKYDISFAGFRLQEINCCTTCGRRRGHAIRRTSYSYVKDFIEKNNCKLISEEYNGEKKDIVVVFKCGHKETTTYDRFKNRKDYLCIDCDYKKRGINCSLDYSYVKEYIEGKGYILLSEEYLGKDVPLKVIVACGHEHEITFGNLKKDTIHLCKKCQDSSRGERKIKKELKNFQDKSLLIFESQYKFSDCIDKRKLSFDFAIWKNNGEFILCEFQGLQHEQPVDFFGGIKTFESQKRRDEIKKEYCIKNNYRLLEIYHYDYDNIEKILGKEILEQKDG